MPSQPQLEGMLTAWGLWLRTADIDVSQVRSSFELLQETEEEIISSARDVLTQDMAEVAVKVECLITLLPKKYQRALIAKYFFRWSNEIAGDRIARDMLALDRRKNKSWQGVGRRQFERMLFTAQGSLQTLWAVYG